MQLRETGDIKDGVSIVSCMLSHSQWRKSSFDMKELTFPGESVSIPTLTIPCGRVTPDREHEPEKQIHVVWGMLTREDMTTIRGSNEQVHEASWICERGRGGSWSNGEVRLVEVVWECDTVLVGFITLELVFEVLAALATPRKQAQTTTETIRRDRGTCGRITLSFKLALRT